MTDYFNKYKYVITDGPITHRYKPDPSYANPEFEKLMNSKFVGNDDYPNITDYITDYSGYYMVEFGDFRQRMYFKDGKLHRKRKYEYSFVSYYYNRPYIQLTADNGICSGRWFAKITTRRHARSTWLSTDEPIEFDSSMVSVSGIIKKIVAPHTTLFSFQVMDIDGKKYDTYLVRKWCDQHGTNIHEMNDIDKLAFKFSGIPEFNYKVLDSIK